MAHELGCHYRCESLPDGAQQADALALVQKLNADPAISGVLLLKPLAAGLSQLDLYKALDPLKDVEAVHPENVGLLTLGWPRYVPSTPASCFFLLDSYLRSSGRDPARFYTGKNVVLVGRSNNVGKPGLWLAMARNATVTSCDQHTSEAGLLHQHTKAADILIVAAGVPGLIRADHVKSGVIAIDVGINFVPDPSGGAPRLVGDIDFASVAPVAEAISPVPGGVGPVTDVSLLRNVIAAANPI